MSGRDPDAFVAVQYEALRQYLDSYINSPRQLASSKSTQRISARERLSGLSKQQLLDLVTDVYDEIDRRIHNSNEVPFLPIRPDLHQKRNQARQKLATMGTAPFKDFASDIMVQIERRFPHFVEAYDAKFGGPQAVPANNGYSDNDHQSLMNNQPIEPPKPRGNEFQPNGFSGVDDYEGKLEELRARVKELEKELQAKAELETAYRKLEEEHARLKEDYDILQEDFSNQQATAQDIKSEASNLLEEIKDLSARNQQLTDEVNALRKGRPDEVGPARDAKPQYPDKGSPRSYNEPKEPASNGGNNFGQGVIDRERVSAYQSAVDDLLRAAREAPSNVLVAMKAIVIACKTITEDTETYEDEKDNLESVKGRLSGALTGLMHAAKNHATNFGSSPVSLLESAASNLTATIVELVKIFKLKGEEQDDYRQDERRYTDVSDVNRKQPPALDMYDLKHYLERQTDQIVQSIQTLLHSMRQSANGKEFQDIIIGITRTVNEVIMESDRSIMDVASPDLRDRIKPVLDDLSAANQKLNDLGYAIVEQPQSKTLKQRIASSSYDIAKFVKELISIIGETF
ncbi:hypothetical protein BC829DRAFT_443611 [Chytridium lagenaria]|nr:hypothetical protein BC829DRAFT_443611 [Chytridium lagenaria]